MEIDVKFRNGLMSSSEPSEQPTPFKELEPLFAEPTREEEAPQISKILKLESLAPGQIDGIRSDLSRYGKIVFLENHYFNKDVLIVKYERLDDAIRAYEELKGEGINTFYVI